MSFANKSEKYYLHKYRKYKQRYLDLKAQRGGDCTGLQGTEWQKLVSAGTMYNTKGIIETPSGGRIFGCTGNNIDGQRIDINKFFKEREGKFKEQINEFEKHKESVEEKYARQPDEKEESLAKNLDELLKYTDLAFILDFAYEERARNNYIILSSDQKKILGLNGFDTQKSTKKSLREWILLVLNQIPLLNFKSLMARINYLCHFCNEKLPNFNPEICNKDEPKLPEPTPQQQQQQQPMTKQEFHMVMTEFVKEIVKSKSMIGECLSWLRENKARIESGNLPKDIKENIEKYLTIKGELTNTLIVGLKRSTETKEKK